jgi:replicative DNA helicase
VIDENPEARDLATPPHDVQAEQAVLGSIFKYPPAIHDVLDRLTPESFYDVRNRLVFAAMVSLVRQEIPIDYHTTSAELERMDTYERAGGLVYLSDIGIATPSAAYIEYYGQIVADITFGDC